MDHSVLGLLLQKLAWVYGPMSPAQGIFPHGVCTPADFRLVPSIVSPPAAAKPPENPAQASLPPWV